jgi:sulfhydrogenase subunit alpha
MKKELISRVEGHGSIGLKIKGRRVESVELDILTPPRLFEKLIVGRHFNDVPTIVSRICSICSASHRVISVMAIEDAFGVKVPREAVLLRELLLHAETLESHGLHLFLLALPDYYGYSSFVDMAKDLPDAGSLGFKVKGIGNRMQECIGGRAIHQITPVVGGMSAGPSRASLQRIRQEAEALIGEVSGFLSKEIPPLQYTPLVEVSNWVSLADRGYGYTGGDILINGKEKVQVRDFYQKFHESALPPSYTKHTLYGKEPFMVGALPRILNSGSKLKGSAGALLKKLGIMKSRSTYMNNMAQGVEILFSIERVVEIIGELLDLDLPEGQDGGITAEFSPVAGTGTAAIEAPRGMLVHTYTFDEKGYVTEGDITTPTAMNLSDMERTLMVMAETLIKETPDIKPALETLVRAYDPCISCSVHIVRL